MVDKSSKLDKYTSNMNATGASTGVGCGGISAIASGGCGVGCNSPNIAGSGSNTALLQVLQGSQSNSQKPVPMKLFAAWEVDRTPPNCMPRLCSLTITRLSILTPLPGDMTSLSLAVKMQSSKRTLRSHEIPISVAGLSQQQQQTSTVMPSVSSVGSMDGVGGSGAGGGLGAVYREGNFPSIGGNSATNAGILCASSVGNSSSGSIAMGSTGGANSIASTHTVPLLETELDLHFSLQYPHFIKRDGNRLVILLQRRKKYKSRTILGYKTLAEGIIRMDAVLQKSMDMTVELISAGKNGRPGIAVASLRAERVSSIPVDQDNKNNNNVLLTDRVAEYSDEDEEAEFSSGEFNDEANDMCLPGNETKRAYNAAKHDSNMRKYRKFQHSAVEDVAMGPHPVAVDSDSEFELKDKGSSRAKISRTISLQQRNFKQKIFALLKRFKASEELEGEANRGTAALRGERDLDALFQELESLSCCEGDDSGPDMDSLSIGSTPKPSLRPFFTNSRITLHDNGAGGGNFERRSSDKSDQLTNSSYNIEHKQKCIHLTNNNNLATTPDRGLDYPNDSSGNEGYVGNTDGQNSDPQNSPPRIDYMRLQQQQTQLSTPVNTTSAPVVNEKRSRLFRTSSNTLTTGAVGGKKKQMLSLATEPRSVLDTCLSPTNVEPRKLLLDQLSRVFVCEDSAIPEVVTLISSPEALSSSGLIPKLMPIFVNSFKPAFVPQNTAEVKAILQALMGKIQKYCNSNAKPPTTVKILLIGGDWLQGAALRHYVELMGVRPPDWLNHLRFYIVPMGINISSIARYLSQIDQSYGTMFGSENWYQLCDRAAVTTAAVFAGTSNTTTTTTTVLHSSLLSDAVAINKSDIAELINRIQLYLHAAGPCTQIPIAEAMVNYKDEDSCQIFVPFISDVRIGYLDGPQASLDLEENATTQLQTMNVSSSSITLIPISATSSATMNASGSPPQGGRMSPPLHTPPLSATQRQDQRGGVETPQQTPSSSTIAEAMELQVDYWPVLARHGHEHSAKDRSTTRSGDQGGKNSIKSTFRSLQVWRLPLNAQLGEMANGLTVSFATREKKQKQIMRLGKKKEKDRDLEKEQCVEGVARLICSPKPSHPVPLRVYIDGTEWTGVKFFQLSSQWQTHVKNFPIALIGCTPMACSEMT